MDAHPSLLSRSGLAWVGSVLVGLAAGGYAGIPVWNVAAAAAGDVAGTLARGVVLGALLGIAQALFLRGRIPVPGLWVPATVAGYAVGLLVGSPFEDVFDMRTIGIPSGLCIGLGVGLLQARLLRPRWADAATWTKRNVAAFGIAYALAHIAPMVLGAEPRAQAFSPAVAGLAAGIVLWPAVGALQHAVHRHGSHRARTT